MFNVHHLVSATARLFLSLADKNDNAWNFRHRAMNWLERRWRWQKIRKTNCLWSALRNPDFTGVTFWTSICFAQCSKACIQLSDPFSDLAFFLHSLKISLFLIKSCRIDLFCGSKIGDKRRGSFGFDRKIGTRADRVAAASDLFDWENGHKTRLLKWKLHWLNVNNSPI